MKILLSIITVLLLGAVITLLAINYDGTVQIDVAGNTVIFPLVFLIVGIILLFAALYFLIRLFSALRRAPGAISRKRTRGRHIKSRASFKRGMIEMTEGNWSRAERSLAGSASKSDMPLLNYLAAARVAQQQGKIEQRDEFLGKAAAVDAEHQLAVGLVKAELQLGNQENDQAMETLSQLNQTNEGNPKVQQLLAANLYERGSWQELLELLPGLSKNKTVSKTDYQRYAIESYRQLLREYAVAEDRQSFDSLWKSLPKALRNEHELIKCYVRQLIRFDDAKVAGPFIRKYLKQNWDEEVVAMYSELNIADYKVGLAQSEKWLKQYPDSPGLLAMAGFLNAKAELWGKARSLLEQSLALKPSPQTYKLLGDVLMKMEDTETATEYYQAGLKAAVSELG